MPDCWKQGSAYKFTTCACRECGKHYPCPFSGWVCLLLLALHYGEVICFVDGSFFCSSHLPDPVAAMKTITYSSKPDTGEDMPSLCEKLIPTLERLESLSEVCCLNPLELLGPLT